MSSTRNEARDRQAAPRSIVRSIIEDRSRSRLSRSQIREIEQAIEHLSLDESAKHYLRSRWLDQVIWFTKSSNVNGSLYRMLRLPAILGNALIPGLLGIMVSGKASPAVRQGAFLFSIMIGVGNALEQSLHAGDRWRLYHYAADLLQSEGWQFFHLTGGYQGDESVSKAFPDFVYRVEEITRRQSDLYLSGITQDVRQDLAEQTHKGMQGQSDPSGGHSAAKT